MSARRAIAAAAAACALATPATSAADPPKAHAAFAFDAIPVGAYPPPLDGKLPAVLRDDAPPELRLVGEERSLAAWKKQRFGDVTVRIEPAAPAAAFVSLGSPSNGARVLTCSRTGAAVLPLHWELFTIDAAGKGSLLIGDGFVDSKRCTVHVERRVTLPLATLAVLEDTPALLAMRTDDSITLFWPTATGAGAVAGAPKLEQPVPMPHVTLPVHKGVTATASASYVLYTLSDWGRQVRGEKVVRPAPQGLADVDVDIVQAVGDEKPMVLVRAGPSN